MFAPDLVVELGGLHTELTGWLWLTVGLAGMAGATSSDMAARNGAAMTQTVGWISLSARLALLAASPSQLPTALVSAAVFGAAYMTLSGLYLVTGMRLLPDRLSVGPVLPFLSIAIGQAVASPLAGWLTQYTGYADAFAAIAAAGLLLAPFSPLLPLHGKAQVRHPPADALPHEASDAAPQELPGETADATPDGTIDAVADETGEARP